MTSGHDPYAFYIAVDLLDANDISIESFLRRLFAEPTVASRPIVNTFVQNIFRVLDILNFNSRTQQNVEKWVKETFTKRLERQMFELSQPSSGYHFVAHLATSQRLKGFTIQRLEEGMKEKAPDIWDLIERLLQADPELTKRRQKARVDREKARQEGGGARKRRARRGIEDDEDELEIYDIVNCDEDEPEDIEEQLETQLKSLRVVVSHSLSF